MENNEVLVRVLKTIKQGNGDMVLLSSCLQLLDELVGPDNSLILLSQLNR